MKQIYNSYNHMLNAQNRNHGGFLIIYMRRINRNMVFSMRKPNFMKKLSLIMLKADTNSKKLERYLARSFDKY